MVLHERITVANETLVLIVEDNDDDIFMLQHAFKKAGITNPVHIVSTGKEAIAFLAGTHPYCDWDKFPLPSIVLLDLKLPDVSGLEVLAWIRNTIGIQRMRVAILSSFSSSKEIKLAYELGANGFHTKPVCLGDLIEMVKTFRLHWLEHSRAPEVSRTLLPTRPD
jgi:CheY-like chemotaxis protein